MTGGTDDRPAAGPAADDTDDAAVMDLSDDTALAAENGEADAPRKAFVQSLERGLSVVMAFDADHPQLTLSDVARLTGLDRAAARRFLYTFVGLGYMRVDGRFFSLRPKLLELGYAYLSSLRIPEIAEPHLRRLSEEVHESSYVSINEDADNVCVAQVPVRRIWTANITVGTRLPVLATAAGRVLLAGLDDRAVQAFVARHRLKPVTRFTKHDPKELAAEIARIRQQGWAFVDQELEEGLRVVAAPVHDRHGRVVAAVSVSTLAGTSTPETVLRDMLPPVRQAAEAIETDLRPVLR
jgi:IclR family pca regulon transcriptional regulator